MPIFARVLLGFVTLSSAGCSSGTTGSAPTQAPVLCLVAASTKDALQEIGAGFTRETGIEVQLSADDSSKLATQINQGAPADLFLSANEKQADFVREQGYSSRVIPLLGNSLVLIVPHGNPGAVSRPEDLSGPGVRRLALAGPTVPAGSYARQALTKLGLLAELDAQQKVITGDNVRVTLAYVEQGEVEAGVVYATDAHISDKVQTVYTFAAATHEPIVYPLVLLQEGAQKESARKFFEYLQGPQAADVFRKHGFRFQAGS